MPRHCVHVERSFPFNPNFLRGCHGGVLLILHRFYSQTFNSRPGFAMGHRCMHVRHKRSLWPHTPQLECCTSLEERSCGRHPQHDGSFAQI